MNGLVVMKLHLGSPGLFEAVTCIRHWWYQVQLFLCCAKCPTLHVSMSEPLSRC